MQKTKLESYKKSFKKIIKTKGGEDYLVKHGLFKKLEGNTIVCSRDLFPKVCAFFDCELNCGVENGNTVPFLSKKFPGFAVRYYIAINK